ncbi:MAG: DUF692 domain-containing protein [Myxococcales bacterium]|nr:MAG: DUF692 domain-containing protein [Myxococcales bacterium]
MAAATGRRAVQVSGAGLGLRPELAADLLRRPGAVDFVEVVVEACFASGPARREAAAMAELWPVIPHGIKLSLGSADGIDEERARRFGALARELRAPLVSEHVAFVRGGEREIGHLTPVPFTPAAVQVVARNVAQARRRLPDIPLLLENVAWTFRWPESTMSEADFYGAVVEATGCDLLLDVSNLYANARNSGVDPAAMLDQFPLDRVAMVHLAGGHLEHGFYIDTHAHAVPDAVFDLLDRLVARRGPVPVVIERDSLFPPFASLEHEVERSRAALDRGAGEVTPGWRPIPDHPDLPDSLTAPLLAAQLHIARLLTDLDAPPAADVARFGQAGLDRSREILRRKRVDDALPLLPRLLARRAQLAPLAYRAVVAEPRTDRLAAIADARRIARAAALVEALRPAALVDGLLLDARFAFDAASVSVRRGPFVRRERLPDGRSVWALKGPGAGAPVRVFEPPPAV